ncbi:MAG TPA: hypothetical protein DEG93_09300 [Gammaproteobacteria bacterium]|nr:hypothetical protein [Gammaproteobacteria bacterium]|tara:strand:- start:148 stop:813 length:666 start_codon:yes stop_codon:yes gene_type:complete
MFNIVFSEAHASLLIISIIIMRIPIVLILLYFFSHSVAASSKESIDCDVLTKTRVTPYPADPTSFEDYRKVDFKPFLSINFFITEGPDRKTSLSLLGSGLSIGGTLMERNNPMIRKKYEKNSRVGQSLRFTRKEAGVPWQSVGARDQFPQTFYMYGSGGVVFAQLNDKFHTNITLNVDDSSALGVATKVRHLTGETESVSFSCDLTIQNFNKIITWMGEQS